MNIEARIRSAKASTTETASMKDWRIRNRHNRCMREAARLLASGKGYLIATDTAAHDIDTRITPSETVRVWGFSWNNIYKRIHLVSF